MAQLFLGQCSNSRQKLRLSFSLTKCIDYLRQRIYINAEVLVERNRWHLVLEKYPVFLLQLISTVYSVYFTYRQLDRFGVIDFNPLTARKSPAVLVGDTNSQVFKPKQLLSLNKYLLIRIRMEIIGNSVVRRVHWYKIIFLPNLIRLLNQNCSPPTCQARVGTKSEQVFTN